MGNRFVTNETVKLDLSGGEWIEIRKRLNYGERSYLSGAAIRGMEVANPEMDVAFDWKRHAIIRITSWVVRWSLTDGPEGNERPVPVNAMSVAALDPDFADEINEAIARHIEALEAEKKARTGPTSSEPES